jgi:hypothetical protein
MDTKQAKDFLVEQAATQAAIENLPLSDLEKRMMYFTESDPDSCPDPISLHEEFDAQYDTPDYEAKMSQLFEHARRRLRNEDPERTRNWDEAVGELKKGDHYILILLNADVAIRIERPKHDFLKLIGTALLLIAGFCLAALASEKLNIDFRYVFGPLVILVTVVWAILKGTGGPPIAEFLARRKRR